jgi:hypothetical protein
MCLSVYSVSFREALIILLFDLNLTQGLFRMYHAEMCDQVFQHLHTQLFSDLNKIM